MLFGSLKSKEHSVYFFFFNESKCQLSKPGPADDSDLLPFGLEPSCVFRVNRE